MTSRASNSANSANSEPGSGPNSAPDATDLALLRLDTGPAASVIFAGIICACGAGVALVLAIAHLTSRIDQIELRANSLHTFQSCNAPPRAGDTSIITVRHDGRQLLTRCQIVTDWRSPERIKP